MGLRITTHRLTEAKALITSNGDTYRTLIINFHVLDFHGIDVNDAIIELLHRKLNVCLISQNGDVNWSPRAYDLILLD